MGADFEGMSIATAFIEQNCTDKRKTRPMRIMKQFTLAGFIAVTSSLALAQSPAVFVNFNTSGDLLNNFNIYQNSSPTRVVTADAATSPYSQATTGGVGGGGRVNITTGTGITPDSTAIYRNMSFNFASSGEALTVSSFVRIQAPTESGNRLLHLGFANENTSGLNGNAGLAFMGFRLNPTAVGSTVLAPQWQTKTAAGGTVNTSGGANVVLTAGDWYQMSLTFLNQGGGQIQGSGFLQDFGSDGLTPSGVLLFFSPTVLTSVDIASDSTVWGAFRSFAADGAGGLDNFSISAIPEPGTVALLGLGLGAMVLTGIRSRKR
jgi:hypothetical protein